MPTSKLGQDALASLTGRLPKAVLFVRKYQQNLIIDEETMEKAVLATIDSMIAKGKTEAEAKEKAFQAQREMMGALQGDVLMGANTALSKAQNSLLGSGRGAGNTGNASFEAIKQIANTQGYTAMRVQYNPSSIYLDTSAGLREIDNSSISNILNNQITQINTEAITTLGMQLIFDDMNQMDAFGLDASMMSTGGAAALIGEGVSAAMGKTYSVRTEVEGLMACLLSPVTRRVIFTWSDMVFRGELNQVNANYTMFNKKGEPIRATVELAIQQDHQTERAEKGGYWDKAFTKAFGEQVQNKTSGGASMLNKVGNNSIMNLSI
ncbi:MAG: hypothetical protein K6A92_06085 [Lachnospiraceae bacterium]|nr:hypothetical protein [Lachnospiraceae bacterium]